MLRASILIFHRDRRRNTAPHCNVVLRAKAEIFHPTQEGLKVPRVSHCEPGRLKSPQRPCKLSRSSLYHHLSSFLSSFSFVDNIEDIISPVVHFSYGGVFVSVCLFSFCLSMNILRSSPASGWFCRPMVRSVWSANPPLLHNQFISAAPPYP